jgi:hypothetical protein
LHKEAPFVSHQDKNNATSSGFVYFIIASIGGVAVL